MLFCKLEDGIRDALTGYPDLKVIRLAIHTVAQAEEGAGNGEAHLSGTWNAAMRP